MQPESVHSRRDLLEYLSQSARSEYLEFEERGVRQVATLLKSYIVERHLQPDGVELSWPPFLRAQPTRDSHITLLTTGDELVFFAERVSQRFVLIHTIAKTERTDSIIRRLSGGVNSSTDRAWLPSSFMLENYRGGFAGYKIAHDHLSFSRTDSEEEFDPFDTVNGPDAALPTDPDGASGFRMASTSRRYAREDLRDILGGNLFKHRRALDWIETVNRSDEDWIISTVYSNGKIISKATSTESHTSEAMRITEAYGLLITRVERDHWMRWASSSNGMVRLGEPLVIRFSSFEIENLEGFVETAFNGVSEFRMLGIPSYLGSRRVDVEATDLHTGDAVSFEVTPAWIRIFLPEHSCGNVVCRFFWNIQRYIASGAATVTPQGEIIMSEGAI